MIYILKSSDTYALLDVNNKTATIKNEIIHMPVNAVYEPGDTVKIKNLKFTVLKPVPYFFNNITFRNTQAILQSDAAYIIYASGIYNGMNVLESGIGTGSLSYSILSAIGKNGKLTGFDINKSSIETARKNVSRFIDITNWETLNGDIRHDNLPGTYDSIILDIPDPWNALENITPHLKNGGSLITYAPNFNQAENNVIAMENHNFEVLETVEIIKRNILVRKGATRPDNNIVAHTAFITIAIKKSGL